MGLARGRGEDLAGSSVACAYDTLPRVRARNSEDVQQTCTGGIESCFHGNHPEYIETTEKMM